MPSSTSRPECLINIDCPGANPYCNNQHCVPCATCLCASGLHDGGDAVCVPDGSCSPGYARQFVDGDGDGFGGPVLAAECLAAGATAPNRSTDSSDCDDGNAAIHVTAPYFRDEDGDGITLTTPEMLCAAAPPMGYVSSSQPAPSISLRPMGAEYVVTIGGGGLPKFWNNVQSAGLADGQIATCTPDDFTSTNQRDACALLVVSSFTMRIPAGAVIRGIRVHVLRAAAASSRVADTGVWLTTNINNLFSSPPPGLNLARTAIPWPTTLTEEIYGSPTELWGRAWTASDLNATTWGVVLKVGALVDNNTSNARVDAVWVEVFHDMGTGDCAPQDPAAWSSWTGYPDVDSDGYGTGSGSAFCVGAARPAGQAERSGDCDPQDQRAYPGASAHSTPRSSVGGYDFNCDNTQTKSTVRTYSTCDAVGTTSCNNGTSTTVTPPEACGGTTSIMSCPNAPPCTPVADTAPVACR